MVKSRKTAKISHRALQREVLFRQQRGLCAYCGKQMELHQKRGDRCAPLAKNTATLDHKVARSLGGTDEISNLVVACHGCTNLKSAGAYRLHQVQLGYRLAPAEQDGAKP